MLGAPAATSPWEDGITFQPSGGWPGQVSPTGRLTGESGTPNTRDPPSPRAPRLSPGCLGSQRGTWLSLALRGLRVGSLCTPLGLRPPGPETGPLTVTFSSKQRQEGLLPTLQSPRPISTPPGPPGPPGAPRTEPAPQPPPMPLGASTGAARQALTALNYRPDLWLCPCKNPAGLPEDP